MRLTPVSCNAVTAILIAALAGCSPPTQISQTERIARVAQAQSASAQTVAVYPGEVHARYESALGFRVAGKISARRVDVGAHVTTGEVLAELDPRDLELSGSSARASLASTEAAYKLAQSEHDRYKTLSERRFVSQLELEAKVNALEAARARVAEARAALDTTRNQTGYAQLRADADGVITAISGEVGQVVAAGQAIMTLAHDGASEVEISVPEQQIANLAVGQEAKVELWTESGTRHSGHVREIAPGADSITRTYHVRVAFGDETAIPRLGQTARVYFGVAAASNTLLVPLSALYEKDGKPALWQVDRKTREVHLLPVTVASYAENGAWISGGLAGDAWIVTAGVHRLREGEAVNPIDALNRPIAF
jgi:multidrug efflux system membrane fusion protein